MIESHLRVAEEEKEVTKVIDEKGVTSCGSTLDSVTTSLSIWVFKETISEVSIKLLLIWVSRRTMCTFEPGTSLLLSPAWSGHLLPLLRRLGSYSLTVTSPILVKRTKLFLTADVHFVRSSLQRLHHSCQPHRIRCVVGIIISTNEDSLLVYLPIVHVLEHTVDLVKWWYSSACHAVMDASRLSDASVRNCKGDISIFSLQLWWLAYLRYTS